MLNTGEAIKSWLVFLSKGEESLEKLEICYQSKNNSEEFETEEITRKKDEENEDKIKENKKDEDSFESTDCWNCPDQCDPKIKVESGRRAQSFCSQGFIELTSLRHERKHGFYIVFKTSTASIKDLIEVGRYSFGLRKGLSWRKMLGGSWIIRSRENKSVFLYPDLSTALVGDFSSSGSLESEAEVAEVVGISSQGGIITPVLRSLGSRIPVPEPSSSETFLNQPFVKDPFESLHVEVRQSLIPGAGEGLFTTRRIRAGQLVSFFAGVKVEVSGELSEESDYTISLENGVMLDIPPSLRSTYCGTLGHKACHSFQPSARYSYADHPRFGRIRSISALHDMEPGEEVTTDYRYSLRKAPDWYRDCLLRYLVEHRELSRMEAEAYINDIANTKENQHSTIEDKIDHISSAVDKTKLIT